VVLIQRKKVSKMLLHAHNKPTYDNMSELFDKHNRIAAVQPTGTGKSYLIMQLVSDAFVNKKLSHSANKKVSQF
jgi:superfamily II DNA or RNA helicase